MIAQTGQGGEFHGTLVAGERVLVVVSFAGRSVGPLLRRVLPVGARVLRAVLAIGRLVARAKHRLLLVRRSARRRWARQTLRAAEDRLVHRAHVHLQLLHAAERVAGAVHAGELQGRVENRRGGGAAGAL